MDFRSWNFPPSAHCQTGTSGTGRKTRPKSSGSQLEEQIIGGLQQRKIVEHGFLAIRDFVEREGELGRDCRVEHREAGEDALLAMLTHEAENVQRLRDGGEHLGLAEELAAALGLRLGGGLVLAEGLADSFDFQ